MTAYITAGGDARGVRAGETYVDVGTLHGYREAIRLLSGMAEEAKVSAGLAAAGPAVGDGGQPITTPLPFKDVIEETVPLVQPKQQV